MELPRPIFWGQGMFLQPQHFRRQDSYYEARVRRYLHSDCSGPAPARKRVRAEALGPRRGMKVA
jgi:type VI secretion system protein ImpJ